MMVWPWVCIEKIYLYISLEKLLTSLLLFDSSITLLVQLHVCLFIEIISNIMKSMIFILYVVSVIFSVCCSLSLISSKAFIIYVFCYVCAKENRYIFKLLFF